MIHLGRTSTVALLALLFWSPASAEEPAGDWWLPVGLELSADAFVGTGTFVSSNKADDPYWSSSLGVAPRWALGEHGRFELRAVATYEWTYLVTPCRAASGPRPAGAPQLDCSDSNDHGKRADLEDLTLALSHDALLELEGVVLDGTFALALPTSRASRAASNILTVSGAAGISREFGPIRPSLSLRIAKFFPGSAAPTLSADEVSGAAPIARCASFRQTDCVLLSGFVPSWRAGVDLGLSAELPWVEGLGVSVQLGYRYTRKFGATGAGPASARTDGAGEPVVDGINEADTTSGTIEVSYAFLEAWSASFGVTSTQPAKTQDGRALRFPFYDFISPGNNYSGWYLGLSWSL